MKHLLSLPLAIIFLLLLVPWLTHRLIAEIATAHGWPQDARALGLGLGLGLVLAWWKRPNWLLHTFVHESCHALMCAMLWIPVRSFKVSDGMGGAVEHGQTDYPRTVLIAIAPYIVPLLLIPALLAQQYFSLHYRPWATCIVGALVIQHLTGLYHNIRLNYHGSRAIWSVSASH